MSIVSLSSGEPTTTLSELRSIASETNFAIPEDTENETEFLLFANSFDAVCQTILDLPEYEHPALKPCAVEGGERKYYRPTPDENPLNGWSHRTTLRSVDRDVTEKGLLAGRTVAVKGNVSVGGLPLTLGGDASLFKGGEWPISPIDATVVGRVLAAGGTLKGTATCENLSMFALSYTSASGNVHNAWLPGYATGGSSSGCAALLSVGDVEEARKTGQDSRDYALGNGVDLAIGGDQGGSIRLPAAYSGIYGLKPTHGLVPYTGIASLNPMIDHTGPMARTVEDVALLLQVLAGYDGLDFRMTPESPMPANLPKYLDDLQSWISQKQTSHEWTPTTAAKGLRIGILKESFEVAGLEPSVVSAVKTAANRFASLGATVTELSIPLHKHAAAIWTVAARPAMPHNVANKAPSLLAHTMPHLHPNPIDQHYFTTLSNRNPAAVNVLLNATHMTLKYGDALARKAYMHVYELRAAYDAAFEEVDVLLTPVNPTVAPPHPCGSRMTAENPRGRSERMMELFEPAIGNTLNTSPFNVTGHPAMSMPVGWGRTKDGERRLPVGMQVVAKRWDEGSILKAAKAWTVGGSWMDE